MSAIDRAMKELPLAPVPGRGTVEESLMETRGTVSKSVFRLFGKLRKQLAQGNTE